MKRDDIIGSAFLLVAILGLGAFFLFAQQAPQLAYGPVEIPGSTISAVASGDGEVEVTTTLIEPGFVTIHQSIGGAPGPIIGSSAYLEPGSDVGMTLILSERMETDTKYVALLHVDDGDARFNTADDMPVTSGGTSVRSDFIGP